MLRRVLRWIFAPEHRFLKFTAVTAAVVTAVSLLILVINFVGTLLGPRGDDFMVWVLGDQAARESLVVSQRDACPGAPFILPADGFIGLLYAGTGGPYSRANPHQGIDIFSPDRGTPGIVPVYAAYDGYITREDDWRSTLIQRVPEDPLQPDRQIWLYYTHMADRDGNDYIVDAFPAGGGEVFVEQGTLLGYTGNYNGNSPRSVWVHLHFSIVMDDGSGRYLNELEIENTLDPSPYLGMAVNATCAATASGCSSIEACA